MGIVTNTCKKCASTIIKLHRSTVVMLCILWLLPVGEPMMISYCNRRLLCHPKLQLYLSTAVPKPNLSPVLASLSTMVSYSTDVDALTDKLLTRTFAR